MTFKLRSLALLAALTTAAAAQTTTPKAATPHRTAAKTATKPVSAIPHVPGIPKTLYALKYIDIAIGKGPLAETHKWYTVRYTGWFPDGKKFDSSFDHPGGEPITFPYGAHQVIYGWDTGFEGMHVGGKRRLFVPYQLAYGELGNPPRMPAKANLVFDVELVGQSDNPPARPKAQAEPTKPATEPAKPETEAAPAATPKETPETKPATTETAPETPHPDSH